MLNLQTSHSLSARIRIYARGAAVARLETQPARLYDEHYGRGAAHKATRANATIRTL